MNSVAEIIEASMINDMQKLKIISNNLANVSTVGFKRNLPVAQQFDNLLAREFNGLAASRQSLQIGATPTAITTVLDTQQGSFKHTGNALDIAIEGDGFFSVKQDGQLFITRQGALSVNSQGVLVNSSGYEVVGLQGEIRLSTSNPKIDKQGKIWEAENFVGQLKLVSVYNQQKLVQVGGSLFKAPAESVSDMPSIDVRVRQGSLENSNVVPMMEMVNMIDVVRHFESNQKLLTSYDEMFDTVFQTIGDL